LVTYRKKVAVEPPCMTWFE